MIEFFVFLFGASFGSFLNVCIHRLPREESVVSPGSRCPGCQKAIKWFDNIPLLSYLILRGKCRDCSTKISSRYFWVELTTGCLWVGLWLLYGYTWRFGAGCVLFTILLAVSLTDIETGLIPDEFNIVGAVAGLIISSVSPSLHGVELWYQGLGHAFFGLIVGGGVLYLSGLLGNLVFRKDSMGGGDIKLLAMVGTYVGAMKAGFIFMLAPFFALPIALYMKYGLKQETLRFGPYLAMAAVVTFIYGDQLLELLFTY